MPQLCLRLWPATTLRGCLLEYMDVIVPRLAAATLKDYEDRLEWLCSKLGELTPIRGLTYRRIEDLIKAEGPDGAGLLMVTLRKRIRFLRAAVTLAYERGEAERVWKMPMQLRDDGKRGTDFYNVEEFWKVHNELPDGMYRRHFAIGFWTGFHTEDIRRLRRKHIDPHFLWKDDKDNVLAHGRYWRMNQKNRHTLETWFPMEPELRELTIAWLAQNPDWREDSPVCGNVWGKKKVLLPAAARAGLHYVSPNRGMRRSFATMLASRGYDAEYIRQAMAHEGRATITKEDGHAPVVRTNRPTMDTSHYLRPSADFIRNSVARARSAV